MADSHAGPLRDPGSVPPDGPFTITDKEFSNFRSLILKEAGISLGDAKRQLVCSRLSRRLRALGLQTFSQYYDYLKSQDVQGQELLQMINCITTNKTDFFRERHHFDFLRNHVLAGIREQAVRGGPKRIRIWSAGCSTGEEPYTIAMTVKETLVSLSGWDVKILASDIDTEVLRMAERGIYAAERLEGLPEEIRRKHFLRGKGEWGGCLRVRPDLKELIAFRRINLTEDSWPVRTIFDAIFCRNVVIYFNHETQDSLFRRFASFLKEGGHLFVGHSESLHWLGDLFQPLAGTTYRLKKAGRQE